jgi:SAM-dependent methyltransferase
MTNELNLYACPKCKGKLQQRAYGFYCNDCHRDYQANNDIPDFLTIGPPESTNPFLHGFGKLLAPIYESPIWFPIMGKLLGGWNAPSFKYIVKTVKEKMSVVEGLVLDVATGTGTFGRHIAGISRTVYGIDISLEMLQKGQDYVKREGVKNMNFARADAESLPFGNNVFDGCLFCGSLHIFSDTIGILREVGRTLKPSALVLVTTIIHGNKGIYKQTPSRPHMKIFDIHDLESNVNEAGFEQFDQLTYGCLILFTMRKK